MSAILAAFESFRGSNELEDARSLVLKDVSLDCMNADLRTIYYVTTHGSGGKKVQISIYMCSFMEVHRSTYMQNWDIFIS